MTMNKYLLLLLLTFFTSTAHAQWQRAAWPGFDLSVEYMRNIQCIKQVNGKIFVCAENGLFISSDFGVTWNRVESLPPTLKPLQLHITPSGLYLLGDNSSVGNQFAGFVNYDKQGLDWEPISFPLPVCNSFVRLGPNYFAISYFNSTNQIDYSTDQGQSWKPYQPLASTQDVTARFTWHRDTLYMNFASDRRIYRSLDFGTTLQLLSPFPVRGFQKVDGVLAGQLMLSNNSIVLSDTMVYSLDEGQNWKKVKLSFLDPQRTLLLQKIDGRIYLQASNPGSLGNLYAYDFATQTITDTLSKAAPYNLLDQNFEFGAVQGDCYAGLFRDTIYQDCNGIRTNLSYPGNGIALRELYSWRDSLFLLENKPNQFPRAFSTTNLNAAPTYHAVSELLSAYLPTAYTHYRDTLYSIRQNNRHYIAKTNTITQTPELEQVINEGSQLDEILRTNTHLLARHYDKVYFRPLNGGNWESFNVSYLQVAANANYAYGFRYYEPTAAQELFRLSETGAQELLHIDGFDYTDNAAGDRIILAAHDSVVFVLLRDNYRARTLYYSTDNGNSFKSVDARAIADDTPLNFRYLDGKIFVLRAFTGVYAYDAQSDTWSPYNDGLLQLPVSFAALNHELVAGTTGAGLFRRPVQPTYSARGRVFLDTNNNAQWDAGEAPVAKIGVRSVFAGALVYSSETGDYLSASDVAVDTHRVLLPHPLLKTVPAAIVTDNTNATGDFALQTPNQPDLAAALYTPDVFRPGFDTKVFMRVNNLLGPASNTRLTLVLPVGAMAIAHATPAPAYQSALGDTLVWQLGAMDAFSDSTLSITFNTFVSTPLGTFIRLEAWVSADAGDLQPLNNRADLLAPVVGSYDPNDKLVDQSALRIQSPPISARLSYTIRFQNTGTFPTAFVTLFDTLDTQVFDPATIIWLGSSHPFEARLIDQKVLKIRFDPLALVPQSESEEGSQGYVSFSIATRQPLSTPMNLRNRAGIYFDYNAPIITPWANTAVDFSIPTHEATTTDALAISPNPSTGAITLLDAQTVQETLHVAIYNATGRLLMQRVLPPGERTLHLEALPRGLLCVRATSRKGTAVGWVVYE